MRQLNFYSIDTGDASAASVTGNAADCGMMKSVSCVVVAAGTLTGTLKLQACNDKPNVFGNPQNWVDIASKTVSVTAAGVFTIGTFDIAHSYVRAVYTKTTSTGSPTVTAQLHFIGDA